jgi:signal transduction histidine kinase
MDVTGAAVRGVAGLAIGAVTAVVEVAWVAIAVPLLAVPATRRWSVVGSRRLAEVERVRVNRCLGGAIAPAPPGGRALAYLAVRSAVGGLGGGVLMLIGVWAVVSWRVLSDGAGGQDAMSWYDPITWTVFVLLVFALAVQSLIGLAVLERRLAAWGLAPSDNEMLRYRVDHLSRTRLQVLEAVDDERRRIERDLHDGVQQRLVVLGMLLGRAHRAGDPGVAAKLFQQAHDESSQALDELRDVAWRIYPVVLDDGGLPAALDLLVERSSVPISVDCALDARPGPTQETVVYFTVSEAVTNALKHGKARHIEVKVHRQGTMLLVRVTDDGVGGAQPEGRGLSGLARRVAAVDGQFAIDSPAGGPTTLSVEVPCG